MSGQRYEVEPQTYQDGMRWHAAVREEWITLGGHPDEGAAAATLAAEVVAMCFEFPELMAYWNDVQTAILRVVAPVTGDEFEAQRMIALARFADAIAISDRSDGAP